MYKKQSTFIFNQIRLFFCLLRYPLSKSLPDSALKHVSFVIKRPYRLILINHNVRSLRRLIKVQIKIKWF